jgi:hypothetical protein
VNGNTAYIGTVNGGIWETTNFRASSPDWVPLTDQAPSLSISSLAFDPLDGTRGTLFAGVNTVSSHREGGAAIGGLRITNGTDWAPIPTLNGKTVNTILPTRQRDAITNQTIVLAAVSSSDPNVGGVWTSADDGVTFSHPASGLNLATTDLVADPVNAGLWYAAVPGAAGGIYTAQYGGDITSQQWIPSNTGIPADALKNALSVRLAASPVGAINPFVYAAFLGKAPTGNGQTLLALYRSGNQGTNWTAVNLPQSTVPGASAPFGLNPGGQALLHFSMAVDPNDSSLLYLGGDRQPDGSVNAGGARLFRLKVGDTANPNGVQIVFGGASNTAPHPDSRALVFAGNTLLEGDDGGIYQLTSPWNTGTPGVPQGKWTSLNGNLDAIEAVSVAYDPANDITLVGTQDNDVLEGTGSAWHTVLPGDGNGQAVAVVGNTVYHYSMANNFHVFSRTPFNAAGTAGTPQPVLLAAPLASPTGPRQPPLSGLNAQDRGKSSYITIPYAINAVNPQRLVLGYNGVYESSDGGDTIVPIDPPSDEGEVVVPGPVTAVAYGSTANADVLYVARGSTIFVRDGAGSEFTRAKQLDAADPIQDIVLDPTNWQRAYAVGGSHVWVTLDAGRSWTDITGSLATQGQNAGLNNVQLVKLPAGGPGQPAVDVLLVGSRAGVFRTVNPVGDPTDPGNYGKPSSLNPNQVWAQFGRSLPNAPVSDLVYVPATQAGTRQVGDVLVVATLGRGVWEIKGAAGALRQDPVLLLQGDDQPNNLIIFPDLGNPGKFDVFDGPAQIGTAYDPAQVSQIEVLGKGGDDTLTVSTSVLPPGGVQFDGGTGTNTLKILYSASDVRNGPAPATPSGSLQVTRDGVDPVTVSYQNVATVQENGLTRPGNAAPAVQAKQLSKGTSKFAQFLKRPFASALDALPVPGLDNLGSALGGEAPPQPFESDPAGGGAEPSAADGSDAPGLLQTLFDAAGLNLDDLPDSPGVTLLDSGPDGVRYDIEEQPTLTATAALDLSLLSGTFNLGGTIDVGATVDLHLIVGVDDGGFYVDTRDDQGNPYTMITVHNLSVSGDINADGAYGLVSVGLDDATLTSNVDLTLTLEPPAGSAPGSPDSRLHAVDFATVPLSLLDASLVRDPAAAPSAPDLEFTATATVELAGNPLSYPITLDWTGLSSGNRVPSIGGAGYAQLKGLLDQAKQDLKDGVTQLQKAVASLDTDPSSPLMQPLPFLPPKAPATTGHSSISDYLAVGAALDTRLINPIVDYLTTTTDNLQLPTLAGLENALLVGNGAPDGLSTDLGDGIELSADGGKLMIDVPFHVSRSVNLSLDLGQLTGDIGQVETDLQNALPFLQNLQLTVNGSADVTLQAGFDFDVSFGIDLNQVVNSGDPFFLQLNQPPTVTAQILSPDGATSFGLDLSYGSLGKILGLGLQVNGALPAVDGTPALLDASASLRFKDNKTTLTLGDLGTAPTIAFNPGSGLGLSVPVAVSVGGQTVSFLGSSTPTFGLSDDLTNAAGTLTVTRPSGTQLDDLKKMLKLGALFGLIRDPSQLADGLDSGLGYLQDALNSQVLQQSLPLVGTHLGDQAKFIQGFRDGLLAEIKKDSQNAGDRLFDTLQQGLFDALGPSSKLNLLLQNGGQPSPAATAADLVRLSYPADGESVQFDMDLGQTLTYSVPFDTGLPGVGLSLDASATVTVILTWAFHFGFGLSLADGFYFNTAAKSGNLLVPELNVSVDVKTDNINAGGTLGAFQLRATGGPDDNEFKGDFAIDLKGADGSDGRLTVKDMFTTRPSLSTIVKPRLTAEGDINLHLVTGFDTGTIDAALSAVGVSGLGGAVLPSLSGDLKVRWDFGAGDPDLTGSRPSVSLTNLTLDLGSFFSDFVKPLVENIRKVTEPLQPVIDFLNSDVPVLSDLDTRAGLPHRTWLDLMTDLAYAKGYDDPRPFVNAISFINQIDLDGLGQDVTLNLGSFTETDPRGGRLGAVDSATPAQNAEAQGDAAAQVDDGTGTGNKAGFFTRLKQVMSAVSFPILDDPKILFGLLTGGGGLGSNQTLVSIDLPKVKTAGFSFHTVIPIVPGAVGIGIGGGITMGSDLRFAYDTAGVSEFRADPNRNPLDLLDGFYAKSQDDFDREVPQLTLTGNLAASLDGGPTLAAASVTTGIEGGVQVLAFFHFHDPDHDGQLRMSELIQDIEAGVAAAGPGHDLTALSHVFNVHVDLQAYLNSFVRAEIGGVSVIPGYPDGITIEVARANLYSIDLGPIDLPVDPSQLLPPTGTLTASQTTVPEGTTNLTLQFTKVHSDATGHALRYDYDLAGNGDFDPNLETLGLPDQNPDPVPVPEKYLDDGPGTHVFHARITDIVTGLHSDAFVTVTITNVAPTATFSASADSSGALVARFANPGNQPSPIPDLHNSGDQQVVTGDDHTLVDLAYYAGHGTDVSTFPSDVANIEGTTATIPLADGVLDSNWGGARDDAGHWLRVRDAAASGQATDQVNFFTRFTLGPGIDPNSAVIHVTYTFWVEDLYDVNNLLWNGGHTAFVTVNGTRIDAGAGTTGHFGNFQVGSGAPQYQVLELGATFDIPVSALQKGTNDLVFSFKMGGGSFNPAWGSPARDAGRVWLNVTASGTATSTAGFDPSGADTQAGFTYSYDFNNDGSFEITNSPQSAVTIPTQYLHPGCSAIHGRIQDKNGGYTDYTTNACLAPSGGVSAGGPYVVEEGQGVTLSATNTTPNASPTYFWRINNIGSFISGQTVTQSWSQLQTLGIADGPGVYDVSVFSDDGSGNVIKDSTTLTVAVTTPTLSVSGPSSVAEGSPYMVQLNESFDLDGDTVSRWDVSWGDGQSSRILIDLTTNEATQLDPKVDSSGRVVTTPIQVPLRVQGAPLFTTGSVSVQEPAYDQNGNVLHNPDGSVQYVTRDEPVQTAAGNLVLSVTLSLGGSQFAPVYTTSAAPIFVPKDLGPASYPLSVQHTFAGVGQTYTVTAQATDDVVYDAGSLNVTVTNVAPSQLNLRLPNAIKEGDTVALTGDFRDPGTQEARTVTLDWGDGSPRQTLDLPPGATSFGGQGQAPVTHQYLLPTPALGADTITVTVTDDNGGSTSATTQVVVNHAPPTPKITGVGSQYFEGTPITLGSTVSDPSPADTAAGFTYSWSVAKNGSFWLQSTGSSPTFTFSPDDAGLYVVSLTVFDQNGDWKTVSQTLTVSAVNPVPSIITPTPSGPEGTPLFFSSTVQDPAFTDAAAGFTYAWTVTRNGAAYALPAGTVTNAADFSFTPTDDGTYVVGLTVAEADGDSGSTSQTVTVTNVPPTVTITGNPGTSPEGSSVALGTTVTDPGAADMSAGFTYAWAVTKNGSPFAQSTASSPTFTFTPDDNGNYQVTVTATDEDGGSSSATTPLVVTNVPPTVAITGNPGISPEGSLVTLTSTVTDPSPVDTAAGFTYAWTVLKNGSPFASGTTANPAFTPDDEGLYEVDLSVTDKDGGTGSAQAFVQVTNVAPTAVITGAPTGAVEGAAFTLQASATDPSPVDTAAGFTYTWVVTKDGAPFATGSGANLSFSPLEEAGVYQAFLKAQDEDGAATVASVLIPVSDPAVVGTGGFTVNAVENGDSGLQTVATFSDPGGAEAVGDYAASIAWGDGSSDAGVVSVSNGTFTVQGHHLYAQEGPYNVLVTLTHDAAPAATVTDTATVSDPAVMAAGGFTVNAVENSDSGLQTVATFTDPAGAEALGDYAASIAWGDGSSGAGIVSVSNGAFTVQGHHLYAEEGPYNVLVTLTHDAAPAATATDTATVSDPAVLATGGFTVGASEGSDSGLQTVATFTDPAGAEALGDYAASIAWGDGSSSAGVLSVSNGTFTVQGHHLYAEEGPYNVLVTLTHDAAPAATATDTATVSDPAVMVTGGFTVSAAEGSDSGLQTVATFTDPAGAEAVGNYAATIAWGDGSSDAGVISVSKGTFTVQGHHLYAQEGPYTISVAVTHEGGPAVTVPGTATVSDPAMTATGGFTVTAGEGVASGTQPVATFTDPGGPEALADYSATISWGDGSTSVGTISRSGNTFTVSGGHTYVEEGTYAVTTTIGHDAAPAVTTASQAVVADAAPVAGPLSGQATVLPGRADAFTASFTDVGVQDTHTATFDWGDALAGQHDTSPATVTEANGSGSLSGSHVYAAPGVYTVTLTVADTDGPTSAPVTFTVTVSQ